MNTIYNFVSNRVLGRASDSDPNATRDQDQASEPSFRLFSSLPAELRRKIWHEAIPSRVIEASLDFDTNHAWGCCISKPKSRPDSRLLPQLFSVSAESREVCFEWYVPFAGTFIHPTLDLLYISWHWSDPNVPAPPGVRPKFVLIDGKPFDKLHTVAMTLARNNKYGEGRFGAFISCLRTLGSPQEFLLCLVGPGLPSLHSTKSGRSISNGNRVVLLDWPNKVEEHMGHSVCDSVMEAMDAQQLITPDFKIPKVDKRLHYIYSGP